MSVSTLLEPATETQSWSSLYANSINVGTLSASSMSLSGDLDMKGNDIKNVGTLTATQISGTSFIGAVDMKGNNLANIGNIQSASLSPAISVVSGGTLVSSIGNYFVMNETTFLQYQYVLTMNPAATAVTVIVPRPTTWHSVNEIFNVSCYNGGGGGGFMVTTSANSLLPTLTYVMSRADGATFNAGDYTFTLDWSFT